MHRYDAKPANGFSLLESLCALLCASIIMLLCTAVLEISSAILWVSSSSVRETAVLQIRELAASYDRCTAENGILYLENPGEKISLEFHQGRIVRRPGYEIFLEGLTDGEFTAEENGIFLRILCADRIWVWQIHV